MDKRTEAIVGCLLGTAVGDAVPISTRSPIAIPKLFCMGLADSYRLLPPDRIQFAFKMEEGATQAIVPTKIPSIG